MIKLEPGKRYVRANGTVVTINYSHYPFMSESCVLYDKNGVTQYSTSELEIVKEYVEPLKFYRIIDTSGKHEFNRLFYNREEAADHIDKISKGPYPGIECRIVTLVEE